jgi:hypothetical protein
VKAMTGEWRSGRGVSERKGQSDHPPGNGGDTSARVANMIAASRPTGRAAPWTPPRARQAVHIANPG